MAESISVICDRCRAEGLAGDDPFEAFGALLDFEPVPRRKTRPDGWTADVQRTYIAALSLTGADRSACRAVDKSAFGLTQLLSAEGSESFAAAREEALATAADERGRRLAEGLRAVAGERAGWRVAPAPWSRAESRRVEPPPSASVGETTDPVREKARKSELLAVILRNYQIKLGQERKARLKGNVRTADLYARQITYIEVLADLLSGDLLTLLADWRLDGHSRVDIAETPLSRLLDEVRRAHWAESGEPDRPAPPAPDLLVDHGRFGTEPEEYCSSDSGEPMKEQRRRFDERRRREAEAHVAWEAKAREQSAAWRARLLAEGGAEGAEDRQARPGGEGAGPPPEVPGGGDAP